MSLSKERNRERMRKSRLHKATSVPQEMKAVQPNDLRAIIKGIEDKPKSTKTITGVIVIRQPGEFVTDWMDEHA